MGPSSIPVLEELVLVELGPRKHQPQLSSCEAAVDRLDLVDPDPGASFRMARMEVWASMIVVVHRNRDAKESAHSGHAGDLAERCGRIRIPV